MSQLLHKRLNDFMFKCKVIYETLTTENFPFNPTTKFIAKERTVSISTSYPRGGGVDAGSSHSCLSETVRLTRDRFQNCRHGTTLHRTALQHFRHTLPSIDAGVRDGHRSRTDTLCYFWAVLTTCLCGRFSRDPAGSSITATHS